MSSQNIEYILSPKAIRDRCEVLYQSAAKDQLKHFKVDESKIPIATDYVIDVIKENYPDLDIPYHSRWRHFDVGGIDRVQDLLEKQSSLSAIEKGRILYELSITSVLLDAGSGPDWSYLEESSKKTFTRSEGLAVASFHAFVSGDFSSQSDNQYLADSKGLQQFNSDKLKNTFQVNEKNTLLGVDGRCELIQNLGKIVESEKNVFNSDSPRLGLLFDYFVNASSNNSLSALFILKTVLNTFGPMWPGRISHEGINLGDVWKHYGLDPKGELGDLVPFHKLSQWLSYSLIEPLEDYGIKVVDIDKLTGLPEYRNGGLFIDLEVIVPKHQDILTTPVKPDNEIIVEWRALTVCLLDRVGKLVQEKLGKDPKDFPLAKVLQGGTWTAGRKIAKEKRAGGTPPINIISDGTVF